MYLVYGRKSNSNGTHKITGTCLNMLIDLFSGFFDFKKRSALLGRVRFCGRVRYRDRYFKLEINIPH